MTGTASFTARYVVGCEGGSSFTRKWMGVEFVGKSPSTRWVVVDVENDPIGAPNVYLGADPERPYVSIGLPQGIRRWEFMLHDDEPTELCEDREFMNGLLSRFVPDPDALQIINQRTFTHHGRVASDFRKGNVLLAGDAAHLMPVWLGQGWNSGMRDATNLAWKLTAVLNGDADETLLDTYTLERHKHVSDMIDVNMTAGTVMKMKPLGGWIRDRAASALNLVPTWKSYFTELRFKPMPRYAAGVVVDQVTMEPGTARASFKGSRLAPFVDSPGAASPVGLQFIQPRVNTADARDVLLDDVTGDWWALATWGTNPTTYLSAADLELVRRHGVKLLSFIPETQREWAEKQYADSPAPVTVVGDTSGALKRWFDVRSCGLVILRPDHFIAAAALNQQASQALAAVVEAASLSPVTSSKGALRMSLAMVCMSHSPLLEFNDPSPEVKAEVDAAFATARAFVEDFKPTLVVAFAPDHYNGFFYDLMPPFCIGYEALGVGDYDTAEGPLVVPTGLAERLAEWVADRDLDVAISRKMELDHGAIQPLEILFGGIDAVPTIPVFVNGVAKPFVKMSRVRKLGEAIGSFLATLEDERVLVIGSGGLSHDPPVPQWATANDDAARPAAQRPPPHGRGPRRPPAARHRHGQGVRRRHRDHPGPQPRVGPGPDGRARLRRPLPHRRDDAGADGRGRRQLRARGPHLGGRLRRPRRGRELRGHLVVLPPDPRVHRRLRRDDRAHHRLRSPTSVGTDTRGPLARAPGVAHFRTQAARSPSPDRRGTRPGRAPRADRRTRRPRRR